MKALFRKINSTLERAFGVRIVKIKANGNKSADADDIKQERFYWAEALKELYKKKYNLEMHPTQIDNAIVPPPDLINKVQYHKHANPDFFFAQGYRDSFEMFTLLEKHGATIDQANNILDFGVAFGRLLVNWYPFNANLYGCDITPEGANWSKRVHGERAQIEITNSTPPLPYEDSFFDIVYANAVFIHIPYSKQGVWIAELHRILKPGGYIVATCYEPSVNLTGWSPREVHERLVVNGWHETPGTKGLNYDAVNTFISRDLLFQKWSCKFNVLDIMPRFKKHSMLIACKNK